MSRLKFARSPIMGGYGKDREFINHKEEIGRSVSAGFTLFEILVVVFILSLLAAVIAPRIIGRTDDARIAEAKVQIRNISRYQ